MRNLKEVLKEIGNVVGAGNVRDGETDIMPYYYDAGLSKAPPSFVVHFSETRQIPEILKILGRRKIPFIPRSAGTNLSGGTIAIKGGAVLNLARLDRILAVDTEKREALVEPGVVNQRLQDELKKFGFFYPPDPASQNVSTIGGNIAENAGGPRCLKYGVTSNNILKMEVALPDGKVEILDIRDKGPEIISLFCGSEGTFGVVMRAWLKIVPLPEKEETLVAFFPSMEKAVVAVEEMVAEGFVPSAAEAMDSMSMKAASADGSAAVPDGARSALIIENDGSIPEGIRKICVRNSALHLRVASSREEREKVWKIRKDAYPAMARIAPNILVEDGVVPRPSLAGTLREVEGILRDEGLEAGILFHAGDGNIHPNILFDERDIYQVKRVKRAASAILKSFVRAGGFISGEHGVGIEKRMAMCWQYPIKTLEMFRRIKKAFDPGFLANPDKVNPVNLESRNEAFLGSEMIRSSVLSLSNEMKRRKREGVKTKITGLGTNKRKNEDAEILDVSGCKAILDFDARNLTVRAECGIRMSDLKKFVNEKGFPFDLPDYPGTLGGLLSSRHFLIRERLEKNIVSAVMTRDFLLGVGIVSADGEYYEFGGKTLKNVSGYDAAKLFIGSEGTLGVIADATIRFDHFRETRLFLPGKRGCGPLAAEIKKVFDPEGLLL